jgi:hypothetical protein
MFFKSLITTANSLEAFSNWTVRWFDPLVGCEREDEVDDELVEDEEEQEPVPEPEPLDAEDDDVDDVDDVDEVDEDELDESRDDMPTVSICSFVVISLLLFLIKYFCFFYLHLNIHKCNLKNNKPPIYFTVF